MDLELFNKICEQCDLGQLECEPHQLKGGFLHTMYSFFTTQGKCALKLLNPHIMQRKAAKENYRIAEELELVLEKNSIPILPALVFDNRKMLNIDGQFFYLYKWYDGKALKVKEIREVHCNTIGNLLAQIHKLDRRREEYNHNKIHIEWDYYIELLAAENKELYHLIKENRSLLFKSQDDGNIAMTRLPPVLAICHNDLDSKNVLWNGTDCRIIDLECLSYSSPFMELYETALCWSGYENGDINYDLFSLFIRSYMQAGGILPTDWETIYYSSFGRLEWLEYNIKRALGIECSKQEIDLGISEAKSTIAQIIYYHNAKPGIIDCLNKTTNY